MGAHFLMSWVDGITPPGAFSPGTFAMTEMTMGARATPAVARRFYVWMAGTCLAIAVLGFLPTYFMPMAERRLEAPPIIHIHGMIMFSWVTLFFVQTLLVSRGGTLAHRTWGMLGVAIATAMGFSVIAVINARIAQLEPIGLAQGELAFSWVQVSGVLVFGTLFVLAIVNLKKSEMHKRLMVLATISLLDAPIARWFKMFLAPPHVTGVPDSAPPVFLAVPPGLIADLLIVAAIAFDWRTRGRPHPVYLIGGASILLVQLTRLPISADGAMAVHRRVDRASGRLAGATSA